MDAAGYAHPPVRVPVPVFCYAALAVCESHEIAVNLQPARPRGKCESVNVRAATNSQLRIAMKIRAGIDWQRRKKML